MNTFIKWRWLGKLYSLPAIRFNIVYAIENEKERRRKEKKNYTPSAVARYIINHTIPTNDPMHIPNYSVRVNNIYFKLIL